MTEDHYAFPPAMAADFIEWRVMVEGPAEVADFEEGVARMALEPGFGAAAIHVPEGGDFAPGEVQGDGATFAGKGAATGAAVFRRPVDAGGALQDEGRPVEGHKGLVGEQERSYPRPQAAAGKWNGC